MKVTKRYFWLPIDTNAERRWVDILANGSKILDLELNISEGPHNMYGVLDLRDYLEKDITFSGPLPKGWTEKILIADYPPQDSCSQRPMLHFTPRAGWMNDPNGLIYDHGVYHFFFQYNPYDIQWGNMHWGHAVSRDLISWRQLESALCPDMDGTMYSGSAIMDNKGLAGYGKNAILFYYTAAGGENPWSKGAPFRQKLAYSTDGGFTLQKSGKTMVDCLAQGNRDPKVFYHAPSNSYIMALFLKDHDFALLRSDNLLDWEVTQTLTLENCWECPDLFELPIDGGPEKKWVFWCADGFYYTGDFDGRVFTLDQEGQKQAYCSNLAYAAQTYSNTEGRCISIPWLRTTNRGLPFTGMAGIPMELSLTQRGSGTFLCFQFVRELLDYRSGHLQMEDGRIFHSESIPFELCINLPAKNKGLMKIDFLNLQLLIDSTNGLCSIGSQSFSFDSAEAFDIRLVCDYGVVELTAANGRIYLPVQQDADTLSGSITIQTEQGFHTDLIDFYTLER